MSQPLPVMNEHLKSTHAIPKVRTIIYPDKPLKQRGCNLAFRLKIGNIQI